MKSAKKLTDIQLGLLVLYSDGKPLSRPPEGLAEKRFKSATAELVKRGLVELQPLGHAVTPAGLKWFNDRVPITMRARLRAMIRGDRS